MRTRALALAARRPSLVFRVRCSAGGRVARGAGCAAVALPGAPAAAQRAPLLGTAVTSSICCSGVQHSPVLDACRTGDMRRRHSSSQAAHPNGRRPRRRNSRGDRRQREKPLSEADAASRQVTRRITELIEAGDREAAWLELTAQPQPNGFHCTAMVAGCTTADQIRQLRALMGAAGVNAEMPFLSALHTFWVANRNVEEAVAVLHEISRAENKGSEKRWRGLAVVGLRELLAAQPTAPAEMAEASAARLYLAKLQGAGLARAEHFNVVLLHCGEDDAQAAMLLEAMDHAGIGKTLATVTTLFGRLIRLERYDRAAGELASAMCLSHGLHLADDERQRLLATATNTLKQLCSQDAAATTVAPTISTDRDVVAPTIEGAGGGGSSGAFLNALIAHKVATPTHFNVCLGAIRSSLAISDLHGQTNAPGDAHCTQVITHVSDLLQKMGRAGLQPDGATYSVLHGMWLRLGNLPQAVGALAQAKQRAAQSHARSAGGGFRDRIAAADSTDDAASSLPIGEPLWDQVLRDEEIGRHLRSMATVTCLEKRNGKQEDVVRRSRSARAAERLNHNEEEHQGPRAANLEQLFSYFAELRRQAVTSTAVYNAMFDTCQSSAEIRNLLSQMETDGVEADLQTYMALHQAWVRSADLDAAMTTLRVWDLPSAGELGMDAASQSTLLHNTMADLIENAMKVAPGARSLIQGSPVVQGYMEALQAQGLLEPLHVAMALPLCDSIEAVERAAGTIAKTRSSGSNAVVAGALVQAWSRIGRYEEMVQTTWKALESGGWEHRDASRALTAALKNVLGLADSATCVEPSNRTDREDAAQSKHKTTTSTKQKRGAKGTTERRVTTSRWRNAQLFFAALQRAGLADGYQYSLMLRHAPDRLQVQGLLDEMSADSALSWRGGGGGLVIDGTTKKLLKQRWPLARIAETVLPGYKHVTQEDDEEALSARLQLHEAPVAAKAR